MKCPKCGKEIANDSIFCEFCGTKISKPKSIKILWIILIVLLGSSALCAGSFYVYDLHKQIEKEVAEAKAAQEEAERLAEEAKEKARQDSIDAAIARQKQLQAEEAAMAQQAKLQAEREKARAERETYEMRRRNEEKLKAEEARKEDFRKAEEARKAKETQKAEDARRAKKARIAALEAQGWIDLNLPSGNLWKDMNESGYYSENYAIEKFGNSLPTKEMWLELKDNCTWKWSGKGYYVVGGNGHSIYIPADGFMYYNGKIEKDAVGRVGFYLYSNSLSQRYTSTDTFCFYSTGFDFGTNDSGGQHKDYFSVRLIKK